MQEPSWALHFPSSHLHSRAGRGWLPSSPSLPTLGARGSPICTEGPLEGKKTPEDINQERKTALLPRGSAWAGCSSNPWVCRLPIVIQSLTHKIRTFLLNGITITIESLAPNRWLLFHTHAYLCLYVLHLFVANTCHSINRFYNLM